MLLTFSFILRENEEHGFIRCALPKFLFDNWEMQDSWALWKTSNGLSSSILAWRAQMMKGVSVEAYTNNPVALSSPI